MLRFTLMASLCMALAGPSLSMAQSRPNWQANPTYTTLNLNAGFQPDPRTVRLEAGGNRSAESVGGDCAGFINFDAPDVDLNYQSGEFDLYISVRSAVDTTLVVNDPAGNWFCNDDYRGDTNPTVLFRNPRSGNYNIWVGTYDRGRLQPATLRISEEGP